MNCSFFLRLAASRTRPSAWVTRSRPWVRSVRYGSAFPLVPGLGSTGSATGRPDFVRSLHCYAGIRLLWVVHQRLRLGTFPLRTIRPQQGPMTDPEISRFPHKERSCVPGSQTRPGPTGARNNAPADLPSVKRTTSAPVSITIYRGRTPIARRHRVSGGGRPPPVPTERSVQISRTTLFRRWFTARRELVTPDKEGTALVAGSVAAV